MTESETPETAPTSEPATDPLGKVKGFVEEHPVAMVAGGILLGALVAGALARPRSASGGPKPPAKSSLSRTSLPRRALEVASLGLELAAAYAAGAAGEKAAAASADPEEPAKPESSRLPSLAGKALRTLGPLITRRLPGKRGE